MQPTLNVRILCGHVDVVVFHRWFFNKYFSLHKIHIHCLLITRITHKKTKTHTYPQCMCVYMQLKGHSIKLCCEPCETESKTVFLFSSSKYFCFVFNSYGQRYVLKVFVLLDFVCLQMFYNPYYTINRALRLPVLFIF